MARTNSGVEILGVEQAQESELGIEIRGHRGGLDLLAAFQHHAARAAVAHQHFGDRRIHADLDALGARRCRDGLRHRAHAAAHETPQPAMSGHAAHAVVQQDVGGTRRARAAVGADHAVGGQRDLDFLGLEPLVEEFGRALGEDLDQRYDIARAQAAHLSGELQVIDEIEAARRELRRRGEQQAFHHLREALQLIFVGGVDFGVVRARTWRFRPAFWRGPAT